MRYEIFALADNRNMFGINAIGYSNDAAATRFGPSKRNKFILHYVLSGRGYYNHHCVVKQQGFVILPHTYEHYSPDEKEPWEFIWMIFENTPQTESLFREYNADPQTRIFSYNNTAPLYALKNQLTENNKKIYPSSKLFEMFLHVFNNHNIVQKKETDSETMYCNYATNFIGANLFRKITVAEITEVLGISQPYLYKIFKNKFAMSPQQYMHMQKINKAKELLTQTSMSVTEIANAIGIDDYVSFSKFFKQKTGWSPVSFRKNTCKGDNKQKN